MPPGCIAWGPYMEICFKLGWKPVDFWTATLWEIETAVWVAVRDQKSNSTPWDDDQVREFFGDAGGHA